VHVKLARVAFEEWYGESIMSDDQVHKSLDLAGEQSGVVNELKPGWGSERPLPIDYAQEPIQ